MRGGRSPDSPLSRPGSWGLRDVQSQCGPEARRASVTRRISHVKAAAGPAQPVCTGPLGDTPVASGNVQICPRVRSGARTLRGRREEPGKPDACTNAHFALP